MLIFMNVQKDLLLKSSSQSSDLWGENILVGRELRKEF